MQAEVRSTSESGRHNGTGVGLLRMQTSANLANRRLNICRQNAGQKLPRALKSKDVLIGDESIISRRRLTSRWPAQNPVDWQSNITSTLHEPREDHGRPHGQERADSRDSDDRPDGEVRCGDEMAEEAVPNQKIENDDI